MVYRQKTPWEYIQSVPISVLVMRGTMQRSARWPLAAAAHCVKP
jgi:hypothetical protein